MKKMDEFCTEAVLYDPLHVQREATNMWFRPNFLNHTIRMIMKISNVPNLMHKTTQIYVHIIFSVLISSLWVLKQITGQKNKAHLRLFLQRELVKGWKTWKSLVEKEKIYLYQFINMEQDFNNICPPRLLFFTPFIIHFIQRNWLLTHTCKHMCIHTHTHRCVYACNSTRHVWIYGTYFILLCKMNL